MFKGKGAALARVGAERTGRHGTAGGRLVKSVFYCLSIAALIVALMRLGSGVAAAGTAITGSVLSGSAPIAGSSVTLYQAAGSPGGTAISLGSATTNSAGAFSIGLGTTPPPNAILYLVASGGNAGGGTNTALQLMSIIGAVSGAPANVVINELTTVAAAYAASNFITNETNIADNAFNSLASTTTGIGNLVNIQTGALGGGISGFRNDPSRLDTLANTLANCARTIATSPQCRNLFAYTNASDTLGAMIGINKNPASNVSLIFGLGSSGQYGPTLSAAPTDWTLALDFFGGGLTGSYGIAIDGSGNIWVANAGSIDVTELSSSGSPLSPFSGFTGGGLNTPFGIAADAHGNVWAANTAGFSTGNVTELSSSGSVLSPASGFIGGGVNAPLGIAVDSSGNAWATNFEGNSVTKLTSSGVPLSPASGFTGGGLNRPFGIAADTQGNVWVANSGANSVTELNSSGAPLSPSSGFIGGGLSTPYGIAVD